MRDAIGFWWEDIRRMYFLEKPNHYYAKVAAAWLATYLGAMLLCVSVQGLGYAWLGSALGLIFGVASCATIAWLMVLHWRDHDRKFRAELNRQIREEFELAQRNAVESERQRQLKQQAREEKHRAWEEEHVGDFVYFIVDRHRQAVKIGVSCSPSKRLRALQTSNAHELELVAVLRGNYELEQRLHSRYAQWRLSGEWFELAPELIEAISHARESERPGHRNDA